MGMAYTICMPRACLGHKRDHHAAALDHKPECPAGCGGAGTGQWNSLHSHRQCGNVQKENQHTTHNVCLDIEPSQRAFPACRTIPAIAIWREFPWWSCDRGARETKSSRGSAAPWYPVRGLPLWRGTVRCHPSGGG